MSRIFLPSAWERPKYDTGTSKIRNPPRATLAVISASTPKPGDCEVQGRNDAAVKRLVAGRHVREVQAREDVRDRASGGGCPAGARSSGPDARSCRRSASRRRRPRGRTRSGRSSSGYSAGSYSRSASWMIRISPRAASSAVRTARPLPRFFGCRITRTPSRPSQARSFSRVPSVEPSSTTTTLLLRGLARRRAGGSRRWCALRCRRGSGRTASRSPGMIREERSAVSRPPSAARPA